MSESEAIYQWVFDCNATYQWVIEVCHTSTATYQWVHDVRQTSTAKYQGRVTNVNDPLICGIIAHMNGSLMSHIRSQSRCKTYCSVLQRVAVAVCCSVLQHVAACCSVLQCVAVCCNVLHRVQCVASCSSVLQCVAVCCSLSESKCTHQVVMAGPPVCG